MNRTLPDDWFPRELPAGVEIGPRSYLVSSYCFLHCAPSATVRIGGDTGIYDGTFFELGPAARVTIGNFCTVVGAILRVDTELHIGNYALIAHEVVITDSEPAGTPRPVRIGNDVWIGMRAIILAGVTIGDGTIIGAGAVIDSDVPARTIVSGNPGRIVREIAA